jgi:hypothetical protein
VSNRRHNLLKRMFLYKKQNWDDTIPATRVAYNPVGKISQGLMLIGNHENTISFVVFSKEREIARLLFDHRFSLMLCALYGAHYCFRFVCYTLRVVYVIGRFVIGRSQGSRTHLGPYGTLFSTVGCVYSPSFVYSARILEEFHLIR